MRWFWVLFVTSAIYAADDRHLAMLRDAQAAFERVERSSGPVLADAQSCVQSQAAMLSVALPAEESDLHYRKGFCELTVAAVTRNASTFTDAAAELERSGANMLAWVARRAGQLTDQPAWAKPDNCLASCQSLIPVANLWLGWLAFRRGEFDSAIQQFSARPDSGWAAYAAGAKAFQSKHYSDAVARYREALDSWTRAQKQSNPSLALRLSPPADIPALLTELGGAQLLNGDPKSAVATLDQAVQSTPPAAKSFFLRARAKELSGQAEPAQADYNLASRSALAASTDLASGEAHLYRGILLYRRKDYSRAEEEFASALNLEIPPDLRPDASAWRHLSAVASGSCGASRQFLEQALAAVSPYFPKAEAQTLAAGCPAAP